MNSGRMHQSPQRRTTQLTQRTALLKGCAWWRDLQAALVAREGHQVDSAVETRLARAACVLDVCVGDPVQGTELVLLVQEGLQDDAHGVAAMALESLAALCEQDVVDFYTGDKLHVYLFFDWTPSQNVHLQTPQQSATEVLVLRTCMLNFLNSARLLTSCCVFCTHWLASCTS